MSCTKLNQINYCLVNNSIDNLYFSDFDFQIADQLPADPQPLTASITNNSRLQYAASCRNSSNKVKIKSNKNVSNNKKKQHHSSVNKSDTEYIGNNFRLEPHDRSASQKRVKLRPISWGALQTRKYFESSLCAENFLVEENQQCLRHSLLQHQNIERSVFSILSITRLASCVIYFHQRLGAAHSKRLSK